MRLRVHGLRNIAVVAAFLFVADAFIYRDPGVSLPHGYEIGAISPGSPCMLNYVASHDDRQYSDWTARKTEWNGSVTFWLTKAAGKSIEYNSEAEWRTATIEMHADPSEIAASLSGVTGYKADKDFAIGTFADGYWLLDFATHQLKTWKSEDEWKHAVSTRTPLKTTWLRDPKGWVNQSRDPAVLVAYLAIVGVTVFLSFHWRRRSAP